MLRAVVVEVAVDVTVGVAVGITVLLGVGVTVGGVKDAGVISIKSVGV